MYHPRRADRQLLTGDLSIYLSIYLLLAGNLSIYRLFGHLSIYLLYFLAWVSLPAHPSVVFLSNCLYLPAYLSAPHTHRRPARPKRHHLSPAPKP